MSTPKFKTGKTRIFKTFKDGRIKIAVAETEKGEYFFVDENDEPFHKEPFITALSFDSNGTAAVSDSTGHYHVGLDFRPLYEKRFIRTFGFKKDGHALVHTSLGKTDPEIAFISMSGEEVALEDLGEKVLVH